MSSTKCTDQCTIDIVNGYLKEHQLLLPFQESAYYLIPALVTQLIISFYYHLEYFTAHGPHIKINATKDTATYAEGNFNPYNTVYGNIRINKDNYCNKFLWEYKIRNIAQGLVLSIGLDGSKELHINHAFDDSNKNIKAFYAFEIRFNEIASSDKACHIQIGEDGNWDHQYEIYGKQFTNDGDVIIIMELDTKNNTLRYYVNGMDQGIAFDKELLDLSIDGNEYVAAVCLESEVRVQLLRFEQSHQ